uniref:Zinc finger CCHC domain-containing protein 7 n=1 Tax=Cynoglossus semilaevis TaxID=244447 RepID=A0A3P8VYS2_CYNSE
MDNLKKSEEGDVSEDFVFIESYCSSGEEEGILDVSDEKRPSTNSQTARPIRESSPPLLLAFPITRGQSLEGSSTRSDSSTGSPEEDDGEDFEQPVEEWMVLGGEEQEGDSSIQLNLGYWCSSESESDSGDGDLTVKSFKDIWAVSGKDKFGVDKPLNSRYFGPGRDALCTICGRAGHVAKSCYYHKKCPRCILCGIRGHIQKDCPSRPCSSCGLQSHGLKPCETPPVWNQLCRRCAVMGHMSDTCPDIWRQYHLTIRLELPLRPQGVHTLQHKRHLAHCYNCSKKGHYGFECTKRMMVSGTFPSLPYVCHYDTIEDILQRGIRTQKGTRGKKKHQLYNTYTIIQIIKVIMFVNIEKHIYLSIKIAAIIYTYIYIYINCEL